MTERYEVVIDDQSHERNYLESFDSLSKAKNYVLKLVAEYEKAEEEGRADLMYGKRVPKGMKRYRGPLHEGADISIEDSETGISYLWTGKWEEQQPIVGWKKNIWESKR